jgi:surface carbohydrate biosynthesis protein
MGNQVDPVVILVDNRRRDLDVAALIAMHVEDQGVDCILAPLEAYKAVLARHRPGAIVFNHLSASHVARYSRRLADIGVRTAVLLNEGIAYDPDARAYTASRFHAGVHVDHFFSWNEAHAETVRGVLNEGTQVHRVGVPRFDLYFPPWNRVFTEGQTTTPFERSDRKNVLLCTNFLCARMMDWRQEQIDGFFGAWATNISLYKDYMGGIRSHFEARNAVLSYIKTLALLGLYNLVLRPHPNEDHKFYETWLESLPADIRSNIVFDRSSNISGLILETDLTISCETCTTALESWLVGKPTISLLFDKHPLWYRPIQVDLNTPCESAVDLPGLVETMLEHDVKASDQAVRQAHLDEWCDSPNGTTTRKIAKILVDAVRTKPASNWSKLNFKDKRRAHRLRATDALNIPYHYTPSVTLAKLWGQTRDGKHVAYEKSVRPKQSRAAIQKMRHYSQS